MSANGCANWDRPGRHEPADHERQELLDRAPDLFAHRTGRTRAGLVPGDPFSDEGVDMARQVADLACSPGPGELTERKRDRDPGPDEPVAVAAIGEPSHVLLDLRRDPRTTEPVDRRRLDEVLLQHGQLPFHWGMEESNLAAQPTLCGPRTATRAVRRQAVGITAPTGHITGSGT